MSDREPVNIMGVFAFPNPDKDKRDIRSLPSRTGKASLSPALTVKR